jgi:hypothetical protein
VYVLIWLSKNMSRTVINTKINQSLEVSKIKKKWPKFFEVFLFFFYFWNFKWLWINKAWEAVVAVYLLSFSFVHSQKWWVQFQKICRQMSFIVKFCVTRHQFHVMYFRHFYIDSKGQIILANLIFLASKLGVPTLNIIWSFLHDRDIKDMSKNRYKTKIFEFRIYILGADRTITAD